MNLSSETNGNLCVITASDTRIDAAVAIQFKDAMRAETENDATRIILNLATVEFIDSSGLGAIVASMKQLGTDRKLELAGLTPTVAKVFQLTRMDSIFPLHQTLDDALASTNS